METLVTRILDSVRLERGRVDLKREPIDLGAAVARVVGQVEERARQDRITFSADVPRGLEVLADPLAVDVVIRNLRRERHRGRRAGGWRHHHAQRATR